MTKYEEILERLDKDVADFKASCNAPICNDKCAEILGRVGSQGRALVRNIQALVDHADDLKGRLEKGDSRGFQIVGK